MHMAPDRMARNVFWVADWEVRPEACEIARGITVIRLEPKVMHLLVVLASRPGEVFSRMALEDEVWAGTVVSYDALTKAIGKLREAFGDTGKPALIIQTVSKKGYRLVAPVSFTPPQPEQAEATVGTSPPHRYRYALTLAMLVGVAVIAAISILVLSRQGDEMVPASTRESIAERIDKPAIVVLPFRNLAADTGSDFLADGLTSDIITDLSRLENLSVIAATSVQKLRDIAVSPERVVQTFGIRYMVNGDLLRTGDNLRINIRLVDARRGTILWATRYDRKVTDLFAIQNEMVSNIVSALSIKLSDEELRRVARRYTSSLEAYEHFVRGQQLYFPLNFEDNLVAREAFSRAIELDPAFARAYAGLALTYAAEWRERWPSEVDNPLDKALDIANTALSLDHDLPEVYWVLGLINIYKKNTQTAIDFLHRAIRINPNYADAYALLGVANIWEDRMDVAVEQLLHSLRLDPAGSFLHYRMLGFAYYYREDYPRALRYLQQAYERNPTNRDTILFLACTYLNLNQQDEAQWMIAELKSEQPDLVPEQLLESIPFQDEGKRQRILRDLEQLLAAEN